MNTQQQRSSEVRTPVYRRLWFRMTALAVAVAMVFSLWASGAVFIRIEAENEQDAAANYLIDHTEYIQQDELERLQGRVKSYYQASELADYYRLAGIRIADGKYAEALEYIDKCLELCSEEETELYLDLMLKRGCLLVLLGRYEDAAQALEAVLMTDPYQADAYLVLAQIYAESGNVQGVATVLTEYLKLRPEDGEMRVVLAQTLFETGNYQAALGEYEYLLQMEDMAHMQDELLFLKALAAIQMEDYATGKNILTQLSKAEKPIVGLQYYLGVCLMSEEAYEEGEICFTKALEAGDVPQLSHYSRAVCRLMKKKLDYDGAVQDLKQTIAYEGTDTDESIVMQAKSLLESIQAAENQS